MLGFKLLVWRPEFRHMAQGSGVEGLGKAVGMKDTVLGFRV